jgi:nicotinamide riboside kinase
MACWIVLCGASSAGKTTLAEDWLKKHGEYAYLEEIARGVMEKNSIMREDVDASLKTEAKEVLIQLETLIFEEQNRQELAYCDPDKAVIVDRGPDPLAFLCQLKDQQAANDLSRTPAASACLERYRQPQCLMVVVGLLEDTEDDGFRRVQERGEQEEYTTILCRQLEKHNIPYHHLKETDRQRRVRELEKIVKGGDFGNLY